MIQKVISGAQNGADIAGLMVARRLGIITGGWIPKGFITQDGPRPNYLYEFGIWEHSSKLYPPRTFANVKDSDGTMRFAAKFDSPGELCTLKAIRQYKRPYFDVDLLNLEKDSINKAVDWIKEHDIKTLNIAGNTERTHPTTQIKVEAYLTKLFERVEYRIGTTPVDVVLDNHSI